MVESETTLTARTKLGFALGDHTLNLSLSALSLFYLYFLTQVVGLRPTLASAVMLVGRAVDAVTDPMMGRISDRTSWRWGRRRPYLALGALPFGLSFAALWLEAPFESQLGKFAYYALAYVGYSLCSTVVAVPYMALLPEIALGYQERTSISTYRAALAVVGTLAAAALMRPFTELCGGGAAGYAGAGLLLGAWLAAPWALVYGVTRERPDFQRPPRLPFSAGLRILAANRAYMRLVSLYLCARIAVDVAAAMFLFYFRFWLERPGDFEITLTLLLTSVVLSLPLWLRLSRSADKHVLFAVGCLWWIGAQIALFAATPEWSRAAIFGVAALAGIGYAVADLMPWAMLGEVVDEDELRTGERREGIYTGFLTFLRKLGGAGGVALAALALELAGFSGGEEPPSPSAIHAIRLVTAIGPALFLGLAVAVSVRYPLGRAAHAEIVARLRERRSVAAGEVR
jgi:sugar (glycoside-pentoside-hexuronide) transporter